LVEKLGEFSQGIPSLQNTTSPLEKKFELFEASRLAKENENDSLRTKMQILDSYF